MSQTANTTNNRAIVIYDGECPFCRSQIANIQQLDKQQQFEYVARQAEETEQRFPQIRKYDLEEGILLVEPSGAVHVAADAFYQIGKRLPSLRGIVWLYQVPGIKQIVQLGYRIIAANRKRLGKVCSDKSCRL